MTRTIELIAIAAVSALLTIAYLIYVGRNLGPAQYGEFSTALSIIYFFAIALSPLTPAIARVIARQYARGAESTALAMRGDVLRRLVIALALAAGVLVLPVLLLARLLRFQSPTPLALAFLAAFVFAVLSADRGFLQGLFRFRTYNQSILIESSVRLGVAVAVFRWLQPSAAGALVSYVAAVTAAEIFHLLAFRRGATPAAAQSVDWQELRRLALPMMALMLAAALYQNTDMIAVKRWFPAVTAGQYGAATVLAKMFGAVFTPLYVLVGPVLTQHHERGETLTKPAVRIAGLFAALSAIGFLVLLLRGEALVLLLFGAAFTPGAWVAAHLGAVSILLHTSLLLSQVFITFHDFRFLRWFSFAAVVQVAGLMMFHATIGQILITLYLAQAVVFIPLVIRLMSLARKP